MYRERMVVGAPFLSTAQVSGIDILRERASHFSPCLYGSRHIKGKDLVAFSRRGKGQWVSTVVNFRAAKRHHHWMDWHIEMPMNPARLPAAQNKRLRRCDPSG